MLNYYSFVNKRSDLWKICYILRKSCALTLADKLKLKTAAQVFQKFGGSLTLKNNVGTEIASLSAWPKTLKTTGKFKTKNLRIVYSDIIHLIANTDIYFFTPDELQTTCEYYGCHEIKGLELYTINKMVHTRRRDLSPELELLFTKKRKIITLCKKHYGIMHERRLLQQKNKK